MAWEYCHVKTWVSLLPEAIRRGGIWKDQDKRTLATLQDINDDESTSWGGNSQVLVKGPTDQNIHSEVVFSLS